MGDTIFPATVTFMVELHHLLFAVCVQSLHLLLVVVEFIYEGWNFNFGNTQLDWIQELLE